MRLPRLRAPSSARARLVLLCVAFSLIITIPVILFVYHRTDILFTHRITSRVDDRQRNLMFGYASGGLGGLIRSINAEVESGIVRGGAILLVDPNGRKIAGNIAAWPPTLKAPTDWAEMRLYSEGQSHAELFALRAMRLPTGHLLLFGTNVEDRERMRDSLIEALIGALILAIPLGLVAALLVLRITDRRVNAIGSVAERIAAGDFSHRLDDRGEDEVYARLAAAINAMLERIEELVEQLRMVTDSLAHDLRSPLTRMRANIERAAAEPSRDVQQQAMEAVSADIDRMLRLISATLEISSAEAGVGREHFTSFDLGDLVRDICEIYDPVAEEVGVRLDVEKPRRISYFGSRQMIGRAVANLVDNALKYAAGGGEIRIGGNEDREFVRLWVADRGPGIAAEQRKDAVGKYRRLEEARTTEGSGLGLALVRAVARLHGGDIELVDNQPGLRVVMRLPRFSETR